MSLPAVGDLAPEVALPDETGTIHRLADQRGRWTILYFYPKDDTPGCTVEACEFRDSNETIHERGADVWGISPQGAASKRAFREKFELPFTLLADEDHAVAEAYGSWVEKQNYGKTYWGVGRTTFLVGPDGRIARVWPKVKPRGPCRATSWPRSTSSRPRTRRDRRPRPSAAGTMTDPATARRSDHAWRPARFMVIAAHPDDAEFGPAGTAARWIDAGSEGWLVCCTSGDQGGEDPDADPLDAGRPARDRAASRRGDHRLRRGHVPAPARRRARQRPRPARAARPRDPDVPAGRRPRDRPRDDLLQGRRDQPHRPPGRRDRGRRRRLPGGPQPDGVPVARPGRAGGPPGPPALPLLVGPERHLGRRLGDARSQDRRARARMPARSTTPTALAERIRTWAAEEGAADRGGRGGRRCG